MLLYESSQISKKLRVYRYVPKLLLAPVLYCCLGNFYSLYSVSFSMWTLFKGSFQTLLTIWLMGSSRTVDSNASTVCDKLMLMDDGMTIKMCAVNPKVVKKLQINSLRPLNKEQYELLLNSQTKYGKANMEAFHQKFYPVFVLSNLDKSRSIDQFYIEKEPIENLDSAKEDLLRAIVSGQEVRTHKFDVMWADYSPTQNQEIIL